MPEAESCWVIHSVRVDGERFRPSDWIERISASVAQFGADRRLRYAAQVHPKMIGGEKCLFVAGSLAKEQPSLYEHIIDFAQKNSLRLERGPCASALAA